MGAENATPSRAVRRPRRARPTQASPSPGGPMVGTLSAIGEGGSLLVTGPELPGPLYARSVVPLGASDVGCELVIGFEGGDLTRPLILGRLVAPTAAPQPVTVQADGQRVVISGKQEVVLQCGEASITLTRAGKILLRGKYLLSRSSGVNRIKGGSVQIN